VSLSWPKMHTHLVTSRDGSGVRAEGCPSYRWEGWRPPCEQDTKRKRGYEQLQEDDQRQDLVARDPVDQHVADYQVRRTAAVHRTCGKTRTGTGGGVCTRA
jgi:hypothetical protein